jgi:hypothetical protein
MNHSQTQCHGWSEQMKSCNWLCLNDMQSEEQSGYRGTAAYVPSLCARDDGNAGSLTSSGSPTEDE